jgi:hypothetical protein
MPESTLQHLQKVWVCGKQLLLHPLGEEVPARGDKPFKGKPGRGEKSFKGEKAGRGDKPLKAKKPATTERKPHAAKAGKAAAPSGRKPKKFVKSRGADSSRRGKKD